MTHSPASRGEIRLVGDLKLPVSEMGWGSRAPRTTTPVGDLKVPASEMGWGSRAPKTNR